MLSVINENVLNTARKLNERDAKLAAGDLPEDQCPSDEEYWAEPGSGADGFRGKDDQRVTAGGSKYSYGPYPRNRRILADVALSAGWSLEQAQELEQFCVSYAAKHYCQVEHESLKKQWDVSDIANPMKAGKPFTFQHIAWCNLKHIIRTQVEYMDPEKVATVKAAVFDMYETNSKTGKKRLPTAVAGKKRKSTDVPCDEEIAKAQEEIDKEERYRQAVLCSGTPGHKEPVLAKQQIKAYMASHKLTEEKLCKEIGVDVEDFKLFLAMKKKDDMYKSKAYHAAKKFLGAPDLDEVLEKENCPPPSSYRKQKAEKVREATKRPRRCR